MTEEAKEARRAYKRAWNKANPDKVKAAQARYWQKKADETKAEEFKSNVFKTRSDQNQPNRL